MGLRSRPRDRGASEGARLVTRVAEEIRTARLAAGLSQDAVARAAGVSAPQVRRIEQARVRGVSVHALAVVFAVLGMRLSVRAYPVGVPVRDAGHARLIGRLRAQLPASVTLRTEVPLRGPDDMRAWDAEIQALEGSCKIEAETVLHDLQAQERRIARKMADDQVDRVNLLVADTRRNREILREFGGLLAARFPLDTRTVLRELRAGRIPDRSGIVVL
jgi:transcriptional regulator with XRE-family HTH domain